jgi:hypothetical protein
VVTKPLRDTGAFVAKVDSTIEKDDPRIRQTGPQPGPIHLYFAPFETELGDEFVQPVDVLVLEVERWSHRQMSGRRFVLIRSRRE